MNSQGPNIPLQAYLGLAQRGGKVAEWVNERYQVSFTKYSFDCIKNFAIGFESDSKRNYV